MANLSPEERAEHTRIAEETFNDECTIRSRTGTTKDEYAEETSTFTEYRHVPCGFMLPGSAATNVFEREVDQVVVLQADAVLRIDLEQPISVNDEVIVRGKTFQVDGVIDGTTVRLVPLKSMETSE